VGFSFFTSGNAAKAIWALDYRKSTPRARKPGAFSLEKIAHSGKMPSLLATAIDEDFSTGSSDTTAWSTN
jgi:hypothetical protein